MQFVACLTFQGFLAVQRLEEAVRDAENMLRMPKMNAAGAGAGVGLRGHAAEAQPGNAGSGAGIAPAAQGWVQVRGGKGNKTRRVPLNCEARQALKARLAERGEGTVSLLVRLTLSGVQRWLVDGGVDLPEVTALPGYGDPDSTRGYAAPGERNFGTRGWTF